MQVVDSRAMDWAEPGTRHRDGDIRLKRLFEGTPENFSLMLVKIEHGYGTPRHRHNYDQVRYCLGGSIDYGRGRAVRAGQVGYFPEGTFYGPQEITAQEALVLQGGGESGQGFMSGRELRAGYEALAATGGRFEDGVWIAPDGAPGQRKKDGYEAVWEHVHGRDLHYPPARFSEPVVMTVADFPARGISPGVARRRLGVFGERGLEIATWRLSAGAALDLPEADAVRLLWVMDGATQAGGAGSAMMLAPGEAGRVVAVQAAEIFALTLPPVPRAASP
jgi:quercetin dioxygenase-like cupin family protein